MARKIVEGQSDKADKRKPMEERVAAMLVKSAYRDIRDGFGGMPIAGSLGDQAVAGALGMVSTEQGPIAVMVLETHYGCTLMHVEPIRRAWEESERREGMQRDDTVLVRFGGELAIRQMASIRYPVSQITDYAYLLCRRRETLQAAIDNCTRWLEAIRCKAVHALRERLRN